MVRLRVRRRSAFSQRHSPERLAHHVDRLRALEAVERRRRCARVRTCDDTTVQSEPDTIAPELRLFALADETQ